MTSDLPDEPASPPPLRRRPALLAGIAAVLGAGAASLIPVGTISALTAGCIGVLALGLGAALFRGRPMAGLAGVLLGLALALFGYAGLRATPAPGSLAERYPEGVELIRIEGTILEGGSFLRRSPDAFEIPDHPETDADFPVGVRDSGGASWLLSCERLPDTGEEADGVVRVSLPSGRQLEPGSRVSVLGRLRPFRSAGNEGEVDTRERYARSGVSHNLTLDEEGQLTVLAEPSAWNPRKLADSVHEFFHRRVGAHMPKGRAAVLGAALLGERGELTRAQRSNFVRSGTIHLLVVSGLHVALLAAVFVALVRLLGGGIRLGWTAGGAAALLYLLVTGIQPGVLRATVMIGVYALGHVLRRRPDPLNALGASALAILLIDPAQVAELGFQLSYLSVLGIFCIAPSLRLARPKAEPFRTWRGVLRQRLGQSLRISLGVGLATWPLLASTVHVVSPVMVLTNLTAAPLLGLLMALALLIPLAAIPGLGGLVALPLSALAGLLEFLAARFAEVPYGHLFLPAPPAWWLAGYYLLLGAALWLPLAKAPRVVGAALWLLWLCVIPARAVVGQPEPGPLTVTALDVGQGQCLVVEIPTGPLTVIDCGSTSQGSVGERVLAPYLWSRGRRRIDMLILSHADADHVNGLPQLFERFPVETVWVSETLADDETGRALRIWLEERSEVRILKRGEALELAPGAQLSCLWPDSAFARELLPEGDRRNESGLVLELEAGGRRVLIPSDVENRGWAGYGGRYADRGIDVLFAPHQGSRVDGLPGMLDRLRPAHVIVSARETFPSEEAMAAYAASGAALWRTWEDGAVRMTIGRDGTLEISGYRSGR